MNKGCYTEKYNIILITLFFIIPLLAVNLSFYFFARINYDFQCGKQQQEAVHEAEILGIEADFSYQFSIKFRKFFQELENGSKYDVIQTNSFINKLDQNTNRIFDAPFPKFNLYVFKLDTIASQTELLYSKGEIRGGKKGLCRAFEYLFDINQKKDERDEKINDKNLTFARKLLGYYTKIDNIAKELRAAPVYINFSNNFSLFIWDYFVVNNKDVYGSFLICDEIEKHSEYGRLIALKNLKSRRKAIGAFLPIYKEYGQAIMQKPLDKSALFKKWSDTITIQNQKDLETWLVKPLPKGVTLGNYTAFCHLERGASHIAVVLVRAIEKIVWPKWLIFVNFILFLVFFLIMFYGFGFGYWPKIKLTVRFALMYLLAAVLPLSLLFVMAYGYLVLYKNTLENQDTSKLQSSLKSIDSEKTAIVQEYRTAFIKALNDEQMIKLIKERGIIDKDKAAVKRVLKIFQDNDLPILGLRIMDEAGNGEIISWDEKSNVNAEHIIKAFNSFQVDVLRSKIKEEYPDAERWMKKYEPKSKKEELASKAYNTVSGQNLERILSKYLSVPVSRRAGDFMVIQIFDFIKINNKSRYLLFVVWDDKALDSKIVKNKLDNLNKNNKKYFFAGFRIKDQKYKEIGKYTRHASKNLKSIIEEKVKLVSLENKAKVMDEDNHIIYFMPSLNFSQYIFVGWKDKIDIDNDVIIRKYVFLLLFVFSIIILWICSARSAAVFLKPVSVLKEALDQVSLGNLNVSLNNPTKDELGQLSNEFSNMIDGLREKERLSKLISDQAVQALQKKSSGLLNDTECLKGVALVSDIRNFTGMSEQYEPDMITDLLNEHFAEMAKIISDNGGLIYKFIGDAIEAVFPEKVDMNETASERAFKAAFLMIAKLDEINKKRAKKNLFTYRIGVGLCCGTMYSGSVGSLETRLDYSILGEPLKKAAKYEALTIQNPDFPLVVDDDIAESLAKYGFGFFKIDSKGQDFLVYSLDINKNKDVLNKYRLLKATTNEKETNSESSELSENARVFSIGNENGRPFYINSMVLTCFLIFILSFFITIVMNLIYTNSFDNLKIDSDKECSRLFEQLNSHEVLKSSFEALCFDFYVDLYKVLYSKNSKKNKKELIEDIAKKYKDLKMPIPKYCCLLANNEDSSKIPEIVSEGFSTETTAAMASYTWSIIKNDEKEQIEKYLKEILGEKTDTSVLGTIYYRRSALASIEKQDVYLDTDGIYDEIASGSEMGSRNDYPEKLKAFVFCAMPKEMSNNTLADYYKVLAGNSILLAFNKDNEWIFSEGFTENEKKFLKENYKNFNKLEEKGYWFNDKNKNNNIGDKSLDVFIIKKDLALYYRSEFWFNLTVFLTSVFLLLISALIIKRSFILSTDSVAGKLKTNIITFSLLPLVVIGFVSYLYVNEEYNVEKAETKLKLNQLMDEVENKELYYQPFCSYFLDRVSKNDTLINYVNKLNSCDDKVKKERLINELRQYLEKIVGEIKYKFGFDPYFYINEMVISGKNNWLVSSRKAELDEKNNDNNNLSESGQFISTIAKAMYFKNQESLSSAVNNEAGEKLINVLHSLFGAEYTNKFINLPKNLVFISATFSIIAYYTSPMPSSSNPDYVLQNFVFFSNEFKPRICSLKNNDSISLKTHYAQGSRDNKLFCFYSPNTSVGEYFFYNDGHFPNPREEFHTVKELGLASSWINSSFVPVSRTVNLFGPHFLEARKGNIISDNVYAAISSEIPLREKAYINLLYLWLIIILSLTIIYCITQNIIADLLAPIIRLMEGAKSAAREKYDFRTYYLRKDELGVLCDSFDKMMKGLEEKQLINRMVSKTALKISANVADVDSKKINAVLIYVSVPSFDKIMKNTPIIELFASLRTQVAAIAEIVINNGGDIDKIMGEKMLIAFHIGDKKPEDVAVQACKVAHMIESCDKISFKVSVGVNYGQVISGFLGVGEKRDFTIIGDPVNVAARIAVLGEKLDKDNCLISETIYYYISNSIKANLYGEVELKGKSQPMKVYQII